MTIKKQINGTAELILRAQHVRDRLRQYVKMRPYGIGGKPNYRAQKAAADANYIDFLLRSARETKILEVSFLEGSVSDAEDFLEEI